MRFANSICFLIDKGDGWNLGIEESVAHLYRRVDAAAWRIDTQNDRRGSPPVGLAQHPAGMGCQAQIDSACNLHQQHRRLPGLPRGQSDEKQEHATAQAQDGHTDLA